MKVLGTIKDSVDKMHQYYGTERLEDAMNQIYSEMIQFDYINWLPILEVCVSKGYLPENILHICLNYYIWKGNMKASGDFARVIKYWNYKGLNEFEDSSDFLYIKELYKEFEFEEKNDLMKLSMIKRIPDEVFDTNTSFFYSSVKTLYYSGLIDDIVLLRVYFSYNLLYYNQIYELGIRKLKFFSVYTEGIAQQWLNVYFSTTGNEPSDEEIISNILPESPGNIERNKDLFLVTVFNRQSGRMIEMILYRQRNDKAWPNVVWKNNILVN
jgi:hypothetical protein